MINYNNKPISKYTHSNNDMYYIVNPDNHFWMLRKIDYLSKNDSIVKSNISMPLFDAIVIQYKNEVHFVLGKNEIEIDSKRIFRIVFDSSNNYKYCGELTICLYVPSFYGSCYNYPDRNTKEFPVGVHDLLAVNESANNITDCVMYKTFQNMYETNSAISVIDENNNIVFFHITDKPIDTYYAVKVKERSITDELLHFMYMVSFSAVQKEMNSKIVLINIVANNYVYFIVSETLEELTVDDSRWTTNLTEYTLL